MRVSRIREHLEDFMIALMTEQEIRKAAWSGTPEEFRNSPTELIVSSAMRQLEEERSALYRTPHRH